MISLNKKNRICLIDGRHGAARTKLRTSYGIAMVLFSTFKFSVNLILGVPPEPMNASVTLFLGCIGIALIVAGRLSERSNFRCF